METFTRGEIATFYAARVPTLKQTRGKEWRGPCPVHHGERDSFAVDVETGRAFCHSTCGQGWDLAGLQQALTGQTFKEAHAEVLHIVGRSNGRPAAYDKVAEYPYTSEAGKTEFVIERRRLADGKKDFRVRYQGPNGRWIWKKPPIADTLPYRLHKLAAAETVYVVEGEKCVHTLESLGLIATTNPFGAKKWKSGHAEHLRGKNVIVLPDHDRDGKTHGEIVCQSLAGIAASVRVINLPGLPEKGDIVDWKEKGGTVEQLYAIVKATAPQPTSAPVPEDSRAFRVDDAGLHVEMVRGEKTQFVRIGPRLDVTARTRNFDGEMCGKEVQFRNWEGHKKTCIIPLAGLVGDGKEPLEQLLNLGYQPRRDRKSIEAVKDFIYQTNPARRIRCVTTMGWHSGFFVFPDRTIGPENATEEVLFHSEIPTEHKYRPKGTLDSWRERVALLCAGNSRLVFAVSCAFAAPLLDLVKSDGGGFHFRGLSSTGKTTALLAAGSVWGGSPQLGFLETWRSTFNGIEARAALHNHALLCLDEIGEVSEREAGELVYALANGSGRGRMTRALTSRASTQFKLIFLSTGERTLQEVMQMAGRQAKGGQEARLIEIPADAGRGMGLFETLHHFSAPAIMADELTRAAKTNYGTAIGPFIEHLVKQPEVVVEQVRRQREQFTKRHVPREGSGEVYRAASLFGLVGAAGELATATRLTGWKEQEASNAAEACFIAWIANRGGTGAHDVYLGIEAVRAFIQKHENARFQDTARPTDYIIHDRAGFKEKDGERWRYYFSREAFKEACRGYDHQAVAKELLRRGQMQAQEDGTGRLTLRKRVPGGPQWFFAVLPNFISEEEETVPGE
jgi:uncharacterized protein (DUF927 family)